MKKAEDDRCDRSNWLESMNFFLECWEADERIVEPKPDIDKKAANEDVPDSGLSQSLDELEERKLYSGRSDV